MTSGRRGADDRLGGRRALNCGAAARWSSLLQDYRRPQVSEGRSVAAENWNWGWKFNVGISMIPVLHRPIAGAVAASKQTAAQRSSVFAVAERERTQ
jgi:hypothetical protein